MSEQGDNSGLPSRKEEVKRKEEAQTDAEIKRPPAPPPTRQKKALRASRATLAWVGSRLAGVRFGLVER